MAGYPLGMIILIVVAILVYFGLAHRILDRLRLSDRMALLAIGLMILGSFINLPISRGAQLPVVTINIGGAIIPFALAVYLLIKAGTRKEWIRAIIATAITIGAMYGINRFVFAGDPWHTGTDIIDPLYVYPLMAAIIAYIAGRSRRAAFIGGILGMLSLDVIHYIQLVTMGIPGEVAVGGGGAFDAIVLAGLGAVLLAEIIGEGRERLQGGPESEDKPKELLENLQSLVPESARKPFPSETEREELTERKDTDAQ